MPARGASSRASFVLLVCLFVLVVCSVCLFCWFAASYCDHEVIRRAFASFGATAPTYCSGALFISRSWVCLLFVGLFCGRRHPLLHDGSECAVQAVGQQAARSVRISEWGTLSTHMGYSEYSHGVL